MEDTTGRGQTSGSVAICFLFAPASGDEEYGLDFTGEGDIGFLIGQVMRESRGKANPQLVRELLEMLLG